MEDEDEAESLVNPAISDEESSKRKTKKEKIHSSKGKRDNAIQGTNDSSIVSKRSVERTGYNVKSAHHQWLRHFVKKPTRRAPLINLGYFIRIKAVDRVVDEVRSGIVLADVQFLAEPTCQRKIIVNLGCGYDPLPFVYLSTTSTALFVDVDYPDLIRHKSAVIRETPALSEVLGSQFGETSGEIRTEKYYAVGCDLSNLELFDTVLRDIEPDIDNAMILFISEVAITYMPTIAADALISFTSQFPHASFAILEQITPAGSKHPFAATMVAHFNKLNTPLLSLPQYPTLRSQARRFLEAGFTEIETCDLNTFFYGGVMSREDRIDALKVELFDEYEELGAFLGHYFVLVARNDVSKQWLRPQSQDWQYINWKRDMLLNGNMAASSQCHGSKTTDKKLVFTVLDHKSLRRRFPAVAAWENGFLVQGGLSTTTRLSTSLYLCPGTGSSVFDVHARNTPGARMCHSMTALDIGVLLIGGRDAPNSGTVDCQYFQLKDGQGKWDAETHVPLGTGKQAIYRHTATPIGKQQVVLFGGRHAGGITSGDWLRYDRCKGWDNLECHDASPALWGASICWRDGVGVLFGGMTSEGECSGDIYTWHLEGNKVNLKRWDLESHSRSLTRRYGAKVVPYGDSEFLIVGGAGSHHVLSWSEQLLLLSPATESIRTVEIPNVEGVEPWLVGHDVARHEITGDIVIVGGGGVCFSFGSFWNEKILHLSYPSNTTSTKSWQLLEEAFVDSRTNEPPPIERTSSKPIRRIRLTTPEQWQNQVLQQSEVCILEGLHFGDCVNKWTPEYLKSSVGDKPVVIHSTTAHAMNFLQKNFKYTTQSFADFIDTVCSDGEEKVYLRAVSDDAKNKPARFEDDFPSLAPDFEIPAILRGERGIEDKIFSTVLRIGGVGTSMWLHYDVMANILTQIVGEKEIVVFPPSMVNELDIPPGASSSRIADIFSSHLRGKGYTAILKPGDAVYIPPLWPHATKPLTPNVGVNLFWKSFRDEEYGRGKDVYGNKDLVGYTDGRKLVERIVRGFKGLDLDTKEFYIKRLGAELEANSR